MLDQCIKKLFHAPCHVKKNKNRKVDQTNQIESTRDGLDRFNTDKIHWEKKRRKIKINKSKSRPNQSN